MVFEQGDAPDRFYIISRGEVEVIRRRRDGQEKILAVLHPGDYFGEIGLLTEARRNASIRAKTDVELLGMSWDDFRRVIESSEASRKDFADIMRERLAQTCDRRHIFKLSRERLSKRWRQRRSVRQSF